MEGVYGPRPRPRSWDLAEKRIAQASPAILQGKHLEAKASLHACYKAFANAMELEVGDATGAIVRRPGQRGKIPAVVWECAAAKPCPTNRLEHILTNIADIRHGWRWLHPCTFLLLGGLWEAVPGVWH